MHRLCAALFVASALLLAPGLRADTPLTPEQAQALMDARRDAFLRRHAEDPQGIDRWRPLSLLWTGEPEMIRRGNQALRDMYLPGSFNGLRLGIAVTRFRHLLEPETLQNLRERLQIELSEDNGWPWAWTNHLQGVEDRPLDMFAWSNMSYYAMMLGLLGGEFLERPDLVRAGRALLERQIATTHRMGDEGEFNSNGYTACSLVYVAAVAELASDPAIRTLARWQRDRLLLMHLSRYHPSTNLFLGPNARTYADDHVGIGCGLSHMMSDNVLPEGCFFDTEHADHFHPGHFNFREPAAMLDWDVHPYFVNVALSRPLPAEFHSSVWDRGWNWPLPDGTRRIFVGGQRGLYTYITPTWALAVQSGMYQHQYSGTYFTAYWPLAESISSLQDLRLLWVRYAADEEGPFGDTPERQIFSLFVHRQEVFTALGHQNRALVLLKPREDLGQPLSTGVLKMEVVINAFSPVQGLYVGETRVDLDQLPVTFPTIEPLWLADGPVYACLQPLTLDDLGRDVAMQVELNDDHQLLVSYYHYRGPQRDFSFDELHTIRGGYAFEIADRAEYPSLQAFREHMAAATLTDVLEGDEREAVFASGGDVLRLRYNVRTEQDLLRELNGRLISHDRDGYLAGDMPLVSSPWAVFTAGGHAELGESELTWTPAGAPLWLLRDPETDSYHLWHLSDEKVSFTWNTPRGAVRGNQVGRLRLQLVTLPAPVVLVEELPGEEANLTIDKAVEGLSLQRLP